MCFIVHYSVCLGVAVHPLTAPPRLLVVVVPVGQQWGITSELFRITKTRSKNYQRKSMLPLPGPNPYPTTSGDVSSMRELYCFTQLRNPLERLLSCVAFRWVEGGGEGGWGLSPLADSCGVTHTGSGSPRCSSLDSCTRWSQQSCVTCYQACWMAMDRYGSTCCWLIVHGRVL